MTFYPQEFKLKIWKMKKGDIVEIDGLDELVNIDSGYHGYIRSVETL